MAHATGAPGEDDPPAHPCRVKAKALFEAYSALAEEAGASGWTNKGFKAAMLDKGFEQKTSNGVWWIGITLRDGVDAEAIRSGHWDGPPGPPPAAEGDPGWSSAGATGVISGSGGDWVPGGD